VYGQTHLIVLQDSFNQCVERLTWYVFLYSSN